MNGPALGDSIPNMDRRAARMAFPAVQFAGWMGWLAGLAALQAGAAVAFVVMPAALDGHRDASLMGGSLFLGGCLAVLGANNALNALQRRPEVVPRWLNSAFFGLVVASLTFFMAGFTGGEAYLKAIFSDPQWGALAFAVPFVASLPVVCIAFLRGGVLKQVEPVKVNTGSRRAGLWLWVRRALGLVVVIHSVFLWWQFQPPTAPDLAATESRGKTLEEWVQAWRENGDVRGVQAFVQAGEPGRLAAVHLAAALITPRAQHRAEQLRRLGAHAGAGPDAFPPLRNVKLEVDISEPVVRVLDQFCTEHDDAAEALRNVVTDHASPPIQLRALRALVEGKRVEGDAGIAWIRGVLERDPDHSCRTLLELRLKELGG